MSNISSVSDDFPEPSAIPTVYGHFTDVHDIDREISVDLDDYVETPFITDTTGIKHHKLTLIIGGAVLLISITVAVVALSVLTAGIPQSILLGLSMAGVMVGGASFLKSLIGVIYHKVKKNDELSESLSRNAKRSLLIGIGLSVFGFVSRMVVGSVPGIGSYGSILDKIGSIAYDMGTFSVFNALTQLIYDKIFVKQTESVETTSEDSKAIEDKKRVITAVLTLAIGSGLMILGISLLIVGSLFLVGTGQVLALAFAMPLLASGLSLLVKNLMNFPWKAIKEVLSNKLSSEEQQEFVEEVTINRKKLRQALSSEVENQEDDIQVKALEESSQFSSEKKLAIIIAIVLLLVALTFLLTSIFVAGPVFQIQLLSAIGGVTLSSSLPFLISGFSALAVSIKNKREKSKLLKIRNKRIVEELKEPSTEKTETKTLELQKVVAQQNVLTQKFETKTLIILASISILVGIGFMLLALIPGGFSVAGIIAIGSPFLIIGGLILIEKTILLLREKLQRLQRKRVNRKKRVAKLPHFVAEAIEEVS